MAKPTDKDVKAAEKALADAKKARGNAKSGAKYDAYRKATDDLTKVRREFREQEAGTRVGFVSGDAAN